MFVTFCVSKFEASTICKSIQLPNIQLKLVMLRVSPYKNSTNPFFPLKLIDVG